MLEIDSHITTAGLIKLNIFWYVFISSLILLFGICIPFNIQIQSYNVDYHDKTINITTDRKDLFKFSNLNNSKYFLRSNAGDKIPVVFIDSIRLNEHTYLIRVKPFVTQTLLNDLKFGKGNWSLFLRVSLIKYVFLQSSGSK